MTRTRPTKLRCPRQDHAKPTRQAVAAVVAELREWDANAQKVRPLQSPTRANLIKKGLPRFGSWSGFLS
jgi:hypothetical protein